MASFLVAKDVFLRELTSGSISEDLNRVGLLGFFQVNCLQLLPSKFHKCKKTNLNAYLALQAFGRLIAWWFSSHHFGDFSSFHFCLNLVLLSFLVFSPCVWLLPRHLQKEDERWDPKSAGTNGGSCHMEIHPGNICSSSWICRGEFLLFFLPFL